MGKVLQPDYVSKFACIASDCDDSCCCGWRIAFDEETYKKYQDMMLADGSDLFSGKMTKDDVIPVEGAFAEVILCENTCPFLNEEKLCRIQKAYGESFLSVTCGIFPRNYSLVNGRLEMALHLSCPHAARLALLDPLLMQFSSVDLKENQWLGRIPALYGADTAYPSQIYPYFEEVRFFALSLLQNRNYCFEDRLVILGRFCNDLNLKYDHPKEEIIRLITEYTHLVDIFGFNKFIDSIPKQPAALLKVLVDLIEYRIKVGVTGRRFLECFGQFKEGLPYTNDTTQENLTDSYTNVKSRYYDRFIEQHEYIFENYFVNYVFRELFPFGKQKSTFLRNITLVPRTIFTEYILLMLHYAMIKNILIGMAGYHQDQFGIQQVLTLIQSFDKNIDRDAIYLQRLLQFFDENKILNIACAAVLIKN